MSTTNRIKATLLVAFTKIFLGGIGWQSFGLFSDNILHVGGGQHIKVPYLTTTAFTALVAVGDALGVFVGHCILTLIDTKINKQPFNSKSFVQNAAILTFGCILSGGAWQGLTNGCINDGFNFNLALVVVAFCCGTLFFVGMTTGRAIVNLPRKTMKDFTLAIACGTGSGCFVGTCSRYPNNWLQPVVGERTGMAGLDIFKAGLSVLIGFIFAQLLLCLVVPYGSMWCDEEEEEDTVIGKGLLEER